MYIYVKIENTKTIEKIKLEFNKILYSNSKECNGYSYTLLHFKSRLFNSTNEYLVQLY